MKLRFKTSRTTTLQPHLIIGAIILKIKDEEYLNERVTNNSVSFKDNPWKLRWRHEYIRRLDGGKFIIAISDAETTVTLAYYMKLLPWFIFIFPIGFCLINEFYIGAIFFAVFSLSAFAFQIYTSKDVAECLLSGIIDNNILDHPIPTYD